MKPSKLLSTLFAGIAFTLSAHSVAAATIVVGGKNFTEQQLMAELTSQLLRGKGFDVDKKAGMGSAVLRQAQENGQIDVYWEYTGTSLINYNKISDRLSAADTYRKVKELDADKGLVWLEPSAANNTYGLAMRREDAAARGIATISDLARAVTDGKGLTLACNAEFYARADGLKPLQKAYGFEFSRADVKRMDSGLTYQALKESRVEVALVFATDGRIPAFDFILLKDDRNYFPAYALTPVIRKQTLDTNPGLADALNGLAANLDDATMAQLNAEVDVDRKTIEAVAESFLKRKNLI